MIAIIICLFYFTFFRLIFWRFVVQKIHIKTIASMLTIALLGILNTAYAKNTSSQLDVINVYGEEAVLGLYGTDEKNYDAVYDDNFSSDFVGKKRIEAYRGTTPSDLLNSFAGVFSGDARNSGAIDPNIRGMQGEGRVKTRIDGSEQAVTVSRGYNGTSNRNYIDPLLTSGIRIVKDSGLDTGVQTGIGGGIQIRTLGVNDFIGEAGGFGGEIRVEGASNAVNPRINKDYDGELIANIPNYDPATGEFKPGLYEQDLKSKNTGDELNFAKGKDYATRIALGYKADNWDIMGAIAKRKRGNYFSGKHNVGFYDHEFLQRDNFYDNDKVLSMAKYYKPGEEVMNTSLEMDSYLLKASWQPTDSQKLQVNLRRSKSKYGEIMPSQAYQENGKGVQWPLSKVTADAYSLQYKLNPADNKYLNLNANLWLTDTDSVLYNSGGFVNKSIGRVNEKTSRLNNNAKSFAKHTRKGVDVSNRLTLTDNVNVTTFASFQNENLDMKPKHWGYDYATVPRKGKRQEYGVGFNVNWQATDKLSFDVGAQYMGYSMHDKVLEEALKDPTDDKNDGIIANSRARTIEAYEYNYITRTEKELEEYKKSEQFKDDIRNNYEFDYEFDCDPEWDGDPSLCDNMSKEEWVNMKIKEKNQDDINQVIENWQGNEHTALWKADANGKFNRADNPCLNGSIPRGTEGISKGVCPNSKIKYAENPERKTKFSGHSWVPALAVNYQVTDNAKVYARYNESKRFPSLFEGLSGMGAVLPFGGLKPEHSRKFELGYVHNLNALFPNAEVADIKLSYYQNSIDNLIDRKADQFKFYNFDNQKTKGIELQARYDNGTFFGDIGISRLLENKMCDENFAATIEMIREEGYRARLKRPPVKRCVRDGHYGTYSLTHAVPDWSAKLHLGARLLDKKLTVGSRISYHSKVNNSDFNDYLWRTGADPAIGRGFNPVYGWGNTLTVDAYARYNINKNFMVEFAGNNLTDQYYIDPASRTAMPAPGRNMRLSFTGRF